VVKLSRRRWKSRGLRCCRVGRWWGSGVWLRVRRVRRERRRREGLKEASIAQQLPPVGILGNEIRAAGVAGGDDDGGIVPKLREGVLEANALPYLQGWQPVDVRVDSNSNFVSSSTSGGGGDQAGRSVRSWRLKNNSAGDLSPTALGVVR
jgi:hypothetical protein